MNELAVAREIGAPTAPHSRHFEAPRWWPEWIAQVLATAGAPRRREPPPPPAPAGHASAATALREALALLQAAEAGAPDALPLAVARHEVYRARRALRALLDLELGDGPGSRLEWCGCGAARGAAD